MNKVARVMRVSMIVNIMLALIKIVIGYIGKSGALIADGIHSFSDLMTDLFAIIGSFLSRKPADKEHPFGHGKIEYITSIVISVVIIFLGLFIIYSSQNRNVAVPSILVAIVTIFTIITKYILANYIIKNGIKYNSNILISSGHESKTDVYSSLVVLASSIFMLYSDKVKIFKYADVIAMIIVGLFIIRTGFKLLKENISTILGEVETNQEEIDKVRNRILQNNQIKSVDAILLLKYGTYYKLICEVSMDEKETLKEVHDCIEKLERKLKKQKRIKYVTIHVNPIKE